MRFFKRSDIQIPFSFLTISLLWIILSDKFFLYFNKNLTSFQITDIQTAKGCAFIAIVSFYIHISIKSANQKLLQSQQEYKDLFYNTPNPMMLFDSKTKKFINVNKAALATYGYSQQEFLQMSVDDLRHETDKQHDDSNTIYKHQKKNKEIIICQETTRKIEFKSVSACLLSAHDITELENAKAELIQRENELKLILNSITDGFFILGPDSQIEKANEVFKQMTEVPAEKVEGVNFFHLFPSIQQKNLFRQCSRELQQKKSLHFENFYDRTNTWYRISAYPYEGGRFSVFFRNITKEKEDELQIHYNEQNLLALINNTEDLIWSIDRSFKLFTFNEPFKKWYNRYCNEDIWNGKVIFNQNNESLRKSDWKDLYVKALAGEKFAVDMNYEIDNKNYFATVRFNPIYNENKEIFGVGCFLQNTTESKQHQKKIEQQNLQLKEIAFITSHQVRVPLANILGLTEILDNDNPMCSSNQKIIEYIKTSAKELDITIRNMVQQTAQAHLD